jgi:4-hydroxymandelate oxidase
MTARQAPDLARAAMAEIEQAAASRLPDDVYGYYATGARDERTARENEAAWDAFWLRPRRLTGVSDVRLGTTLLGRAAAHPVIVGPSAGHAMAHPDGELATARAVAALGGVLILSTSSNHSVEEVAAVPGLDLWFQLYPFEDRAVTERLVRRAVDAGARAIVLTVDVTSEADTHARPAGGFVDPPLPWAHHDGHGRILRRLDWDYARALAATCGVPVLLKGILHPDDAARAAEEGFAAIVVSNHGGRTLDGAIPSALALPDCVGAAGARLEVYVDGGVRRGSDVLKALALGARGVLLARPVLWALALEGEAGVRAMLGRLLRELTEDMAFADVADANAVPSDLVVPARALR